MKRNTSTIIITAILFAIGASSISALSMEPLTHVFGTSTGGRMHTYRVTNTQDREIAVRMRITTRDQLPDGREERSSADEEWLVFPARMTLSPGQSRAVRIQYTGPAGLEREKAYRVIAEQLPIDVSEGEIRSGINVLFRYEGSAYVREGRFSPDIVVADASREFDGEEFKGIRVRLENRGTTHGILHDITLRLTRSDSEGEVLEEQTFSEEELPLIGGRNILAGRAIEEVIPVPDTWKQGSVNAHYQAEILD